jgi:hypothetical protein
LKKGPYYINLSVRIHVVDVMNEGGVVPDISCVRIGASFSEGVHSRGRASIVQGYRIRLTEEEFSAGSQ